MSGTVLFLGAGATKSVQGLSTDEILPALVAAKASLQQQDPSGRVNTLFDFLTQEFHVDPNNVDKYQYPGLPLLMSLIDTALDRREPLYGRWSLNTLALLREAIEFGIFDALEENLVKVPTDNHFEMFQKFFPSPDQPCVISTNYDLIADSAMMFLSQIRQAPGSLPDYHCGIANLLPIGPEEKRFGTLLKLHGSLNWMLCKNCLRMELGKTDFRPYLAILQTVAGPDLKSSLLSDGAQCPVCQSVLRPLLVAPSHLKDYRNPHLAQVWYEAQRVLRQASRVIFVGYSMPDDDVEVVYLVKRSLGHITSPKQITVVEYCAENPQIPAAEHPVGRRYRTLFGDIDWHAGGLDQWFCTLP
jgi:hypothetical protein